MKTKIKFIIFMIIVSLLFGRTQDIYAAWYTTGLSGTAPNVAGTNTNCVQDSYPDTAPTVAQGTGPAGTFGFAYHNGQVQVLASGQCQWWDSTAPTVSSLTYANTTTNGWQNSATINLSWNANDTGGSGLQGYDIWVYSSTQVQNASPAWGIPSLIVINTPMTTYPYTAAINGRAYKFEIRARDVAGNIGTTISSTDIARIDTMPPSSADLFSATPSTNFLATTSQLFSFTYNDGGAPVSITSQFEDYSNDTNSAWYQVFNPSAFAYAHSSNQNISKVDGADRTADSGTARRYRYLVTKICDQAGNTCWNGTKDFYYNVYANPVPATPFNTKTDTSLTSGTAIADGTPYTFTHSIKDIYGNAIIPASGISRTVNMNLTSISNAMFLDQYSRTGGSSVFVDSNTSPLNTSGGQGLGTRSSSNGDYPLPIFVYTPTASGYITGEPISDPDATFGFTSNLVVSDTIGGAASFPQTLANPSFKPLYTTAISGNLRDGGFIEGTEQESSILTTNNNLGLTPPLVSLQLEFSGAISPSFNMYGGSATNSNIPIASRNTMVSNPGITYTLLYTKLLQKPNTLVNNLSNLQFSTHFSYMLDGKNIIYNSDIIGKAGYHVVTSTAVGNQVGVKVIGPIASNSITALTNNQFGAETSIFSGLSRATVKNNMKQSIALATRNMIYTAVTDTIIDVSSLPTGGGGAASGSKIDKGSEGSIIKLEKNGGFVTLGLTTGISGKRTLVIKGADLYIDKDMYYSSMDPNAILGVVVQKNDAGQGGNLYINPSVTNIVGTYIIDGSIISSNDGANPIGTSNIFTLRHQLYIYGSIVSENTIGGSRMNPPKCPSLMNTVCNTAADAQPYDLNYLRRYYLFGGVPFGGSMTKVIGGAGYVSPTGGPTMPPNSNLIQKFTSLPSPYAAHPVIIEYNPRFRANPPIGFDQMTD